MSAQYVGKSRMDNDQANQFGEELNAYVLFNTKLAYKFTRNIEGAVGVNNILDRKYASYGVRRRRARPVSGLHGALQPVPCTRTQLTRP